VRARGRGWRRAPSRTLLAAAAAALRGGAHSIGGPAEGPRLSEDPHVGCGPLHRCTHHICSSAALVSIILCQYNIKVYNIIIIINLFFRNSRVHMYNVITYYILICNYYF